MLSSMAHFSKKRITADYTGHRLPELNLSLGTCLNRIHIDVLHHSGFGGVIRAATVG